MPGPAAIGFPNMREVSRRTNRAPQNPLDKSTLVSIYPKPVTFRNVTLMPGYWRLEAGSVQKPAITVIGTSSWWKDANIDEPLIEIVQGSIEIADALIKDFCNGLFAASTTSQPGMFYVPGCRYDTDGQIDEAATLKWIEKEYNALIQQAIQKQSNYYNNLLKFADSLWARSNGNPLVINEEMRMAARETGQTGRDWMSDFKNVGQVRCFACGGFKNPEYPICSSCRTIDPDHPKAHLIKTAEAPVFQNMAPVQQTKK